MAGIEEDRVEPIWITHTFDQGVADLAERKEDLDRVLNRLVDVT